MTVYELLNKDTVRKVLEQELGKRKLAATLVPRNLTDEQQYRRLTILMDFAGQLQENNFLDCVNTGD
jgi:hypothetical protein